MDCMFISKLATNEFHDYSSDCIIFMHVYTFLCIHNIRQESFNISSGIDSNLIYTANYSDLATGVVCDSHTISESVTRPDVCANNVCRIEFESFDNHSCSQSGYINVSISASNRLGNGPASYKIIGMCHPISELITLRLSLY